MLFKLDETSAYLLVTIYLLLMIPGKKRSGRNAIVQLQSKNEYENRMDIGSELLGYR